MKLVRSQIELKKGDTVIVKDNPNFSKLGFSKVIGDVFTIDPEKTVFTIKCKETNSLEKVSVEKDQIFLIG
jgi:hypothetical protein